jgi:hypothetical protein
MFREGDEPMKPPANVKTPAQYVASLPADRAKTITAVRALVVGHDRLDDPPVPLSRHLQQAADLLRRTDDKKVFVEAAYRYVTPSTDLTLRLSYNSDAKQLAQQLNGSIALHQRLADGWYLGVRILKMSLKYQDDQWYSFKGAPLAVYALVSSGAGGRSRALHRGAGAERQRVGRCRWTVERVRRHLGDLLIGRGTC